MLEAAVRRIRKLWSLRGPQRRLLLAAGGTVVLVRIGLWVLPFRRLQALVARRPGGTPHPQRPHSADDIAWAVSAAARMVPRASCLTQALAAKRLLERAGHSGELRIGVGKDESGAIIAHAWIEQGGRVLVGAHGVEQYTPLPSLSRDGLD